MRIIDHDEGLGGIALGDIHAYLYFLAHLLINHPFTATAKGARRLSDEEMSDEQV